MKRLEMDNFIEMTAPEKEIWYPLLVVFYRKKGVGEEKLDEQIQKVFLQAQVGWDRAPRDLDTRIKVKTGFQWKSHENLKPKLAIHNIDKVVDVLEEKSDDNYEIGIDQTLSRPEKEWFNGRKATYVKDFDFNESSDRLLLDQLLIEELIQRRLSIKQLKYSDRDFNRALTDNLKRITELQERLGITRQQRSGILDNIDGNVAQLALSLDKKLENMPEVMKAQYEEELYYQGLKNQRPPSNILPPIEKIEALLKIDGKISVNVDSERLSHITEEVAKSIQEQRDIPKIDLAGGFDVSG
jgi:hypothetical protein